MTKKSQGLVERFHPRLTGRSVSFEYPKSTGGTQWRYARIVKVLFNGDKVQTIRTQPLDTDPRQWVAYRLDKVIGSMHFHD